MPEPKERAILEFVTRVNFGALHQPCPYALVVHRGMNHLLLINLVRVISKHLESRAARYLRRHSTL